MKNIHLLPTDKPSRLWINNLLQGKLELSKEFLTGSNTAQHIYITSDEEIKEGDWVVENHTFKREPYIGKCFYPKNDGTVTDEILKRDLLSVKYEGHYETLALKHNCKKIILTTDQDLIADGVQSIDDTFLEWFVKNSSCEFVEVVKEGYKKNGMVDEATSYRYKIIIPQEEPKQEYKPNSCDIIFETAALIENKQETLKEAAEKYADSIFNSFETRHENERLIEAFEKGAKWQAERMYSEKEVYSLLEQSMKDCHLWELEEHYSGDYKNLKEWFEQFKKK